MSRERKKKSSNDDGQNERSPKRRKSRAANASSFQVDHRFILAPMVGASEPAFRILCRNYGAELCYSPMLAAHQMADSAFRNTHFPLVQADRPVVCHVSCNDATEFATTARHAAQAGCAALDLNLGCPQRTAFVGKFGSYLMDEPDNICNMVKAAAKEKCLPITVKIRLLDTRDKTLQFCRQLCDAGVSLIAIHARHRASWERTGPGARDGPALLDQVESIRTDLSSDYPNVKVITNGNTITWNDVEENLNSTKADGLMSAEGILDNPALFLRRYGTDPKKQVSVWRLPSKIRKLLTKMWSLAEGEPTTKESKRSKYQTKLAQLCSPPPELETINVTLGSLLQTTKVQMAMENLNLATVFAVPLRTAVFHTRRMLKDDLAQYQLLPDCLASASLHDLRCLLLLILKYQRDPASFVYDTAKAAAEKEAEERKQRDEGKRKAYEARMIRKAKREGKPLDYYVNEGTELPTADLVRELKAMPRANALDHWKQNHKQHCIALHLDGKCPRGRTCAFLHVDFSTANTFVERDAVSG